MTKQKFNVGDKIVFGRGKRNSRLRDTTIGKIYEVVNDGCEVAYIDDAGDWNYSISEFCDGKATKIIE